MMPHKTHRIKAILSTLHLACRASHIFETGQLSLPTHLPNFLFNSQVIRADYILEMGLNLAICHPSQLKKPEKFLIL